MVGVSLDFGFDTIAARAHFQDQITNVMESILTKDIPAALANAQTKGFPKDKENYTLLLRNKSSEKRRDLSTIQAWRLKVGSAANPLLFRFVADSSNYDDVVKATLAAELQALARAPVGGPYSEPSKQGKKAFWENITIFVGTAEGYLVSVAPERLKTWKFKTNDRVYVGSIVAHAAIIEHGFYSRYYETQRLDGGIMLYVARSIRKQFRNVACRFRYINISGSRGRGTIPVIEIGLLGAFAPKDTLPGSTQKRRQRGARNFK